jgi:putative thioredoxin
MSKQSVASSPCADIIDVAPETFSIEIVERSSIMPVVVDFWAPWCGPCTMLSPVLEKLAREYGGKFLLAKVNIDQCPEAASQFGVRSIPAVFGVRNGAVVDAFVGVQAESAIRMWIDRILPTEAESFAAAARRLETSDPQTSMEKYSRALELQSDLPEALIGLARMALARGDFEDAAARLTAMERQGFLEPEAERLKAELTLHAQAAGTVSIDAARSALAADPENLKLKLALAEALASARQYADALAHCLELVEHDRKGIGEQARQTMVAIFQLLPPEDDLVIEYQRQLSLVL